MEVNVKKLCLIAVDVCLAVYLIVVLCAFHVPEDAVPVCSGLTVSIADGDSRGFINTHEVLSRVTTAGLDPRGQRLTAVNCRTIEETLLATPFISTAQCYTTADGKVNIEITQRMPVVRVKADDDDDYYLDDKDCVMPITSFTSNILIATGHISRRYAMAYLSPLARAINRDDFARNLFQQINITADECVELVPIIGDNIIFLGSLPDDKADIEDYVHDKMAVLQQFYKYGLSVAGWQRYAVINLEYNNIIVCKRR